MEFRGDRVAEDSAELLMPHEFPVGETTDTIILVEGRKKSKEMAGCYQVNAQLPAYRMTFVFKKSG